MIRKNLYVQLLIAMVLSAVAPASGAAESVQTECCRASSVSDKETLITCPDAEIKVRKEGDRTAALMKLHSAFEVTEHRGVYVSEGKPGKVIGRFSKHGVTQDSVVLFVMKSGPYSDWIVALRNPGTAQYGVSSSFFGSTPRCVSMSDPSLPKAAEEATIEVSPADVIYERLGLQ